MEEGDYDVEKELEAMERRLTEFEAKVTCTDLSPMTRNLMAGPDTFKDSEDGGNTRICGSSRMAEIDDQGVASLSYWCMGRCLSVCMHTSHPMCH